MSDRLVGLVLLFLSGFMYLQTYLFPKAPFAAFEEMGSEFFPRGIIIGLAIFSLILLMVGKGSLMPSWRMDNVRALFTRYREVVITLVLFPAYAFAIEQIGFAYSTLIYLIVMQMVLKRRNARQLILTVAGSAVFTWALVTAFEGYLKVVLPHGTLFY